MIIRRSTLESVLPAAKAKDDTRRLNRIEIRPDGTVTATDGHVLLSATEHTRFPDMDFPGAGLPHYSGDAPTALILPIDAARQLLKTAQVEGKRTSIPILSAIQIGMNGEGAYAAATNLHTQTVIKIDGPDKAIGGSFVSWDRGIIPPADRPALELCLSSEVLIALAKAAEAAGNASGAQQCTVTIKIPTDTHYQGDKEADHAFDGNDKTGQGCSCGHMHRGTPRQGGTFWNKVVGNGKIDSAMRVEIRGREVKVIGAVMPCRQP